MSATADVSAYLAKMTPRKGESVESFAKRGLAWQCEIYSANAGYDLDMDWSTISETDRRLWLKWARDKGALDNP